MREIKFRGRNPLTKQWEYGFLITVDLSSEKLSKNLTAIIKENAWYEPSEGIGGFKLVEPQTVGQFTGLVIGNKEIYEGDILTDEFRIDLYVIVFEEGSFRAYCKERNYLKNLYMDIEDVHLHLYKVGNIHDNPELFEVSNA